MPVGGHAEALADRQVQREDPVPPQVVALADATHQDLPKRPQGRLRIAEDIRPRAATDQPRGTRVGLVRNRRDDVGEVLVAVAGRPGESVQDAQGHAGRDPQETAELPARKRRLARWPHVRQERLASAEGQFRHPIGVPLVAHVKIRRRPLGLAVPRVDDAKGGPVGVAGNLSEAQPLAAPRSQRDQVPRLRECVVEVELETAAKTLAQRELHRVVAGRAVRAQRVEAPKLRVHEGPLTEVTAEWCAGVVDVVHGCAGIGAVGSNHVVDSLRRSEVGGCCARVEILEERDIRYGSCRPPAHRHQLKFGQRVMQVLPRRLVLEVDVLRRGCVVDKLSPAEAADIADLKHETTPQLTGDR